MIDSPAHLHRLLREFTRSVRALTFARRGRLVRLTVALPADIDASQFVERARAHLRQVGLDDPELEAVRGEGGPRIIAAEFER